MSKTNNMKKEFATYILKLNEAALTTKQAEDRPLYEKYLASAAVILALVESGAEKEMIQNKAQTHERLWVTHGLQMMSIKSHAMHGKK